MSDIRKDLEQGIPAGQQAPTSGQPKFNARRRLIKLGAGVVPVVATLASKPALAWHCQAPSAWGSELLSASLAANPGHTAYSDEVWYCSNWAGNTIRTGTGAPSGTPWACFFGKYPAINSACGGNYKYVTISQLQSCGINCAGASSTAKAYKIVGTGTGAGSEIQRRCIVAQLNHLCLSTSTGLGQCVKFSELNSMAADGPAGNYKPSGDSSSAKWATTQVNTYLKNNYIALD